MARALRGAPRIHILAQHVWPDDAATGLYAEHVVESLQARGARATLVGGVGRYRPSGRGRPPIDILRLEHFCGKRGNLVTVAMEYRSLATAFHNYIEQYVNSFDVVVLGSFPPPTLHLWKTIKERAAIAVYWLQDYYPDLVRSIVAYPEWMRRRLDRNWQRELRQWDYVIKSSGNLGYSGPNATVIRNWPSLDLGEPMPFVPKTALYSGGLGYAHGVREFSRELERLRQEGYDITVRADGPGVKLLPDWVRVESPLMDHEELRRSYWSTEKHLIAADPKIQNALFPSKFWNAKETGREIICTGFQGEMADELKIARKSNHDSHRNSLVDLILSLA